MSGISCNKDSIVARKRPENYRKIAVDFVDSRHILESPRGSPCRWSTTVGFWGWLMRYQKPVDEGGALLGRGDSVRPLATPKQLDPQGTAAIEFHVSLALKHIEEHFPDPSMSLGSVSAACGLSRWHFSRLFKHCAGAGFRDYLRNVRLQEARRLLESTALSVKEVAASVGFVHTGDLDRHMKRSMGTTPSILRSKAQARRAS